MRQVLLTPAISWLFLMQSTGQLRFAEEGKGNGQEDSTMMHPDAIPRHGFFLDTHPFQPARARVDQPQRQARSAAIPSPIPSVGG